VLFQLKEYRLAMMALQETRWQDEDIMDMKSHTLFYSGKEEGTGEFGVAFVVERNMKRNVLDFKAVDERICVLRIKTRFPKYKPHKHACSHRRKGGLLSESRRDI